MSTADTDSDGLQPQGVQARLWPALVVLAMQAIVFGLSITPAINNRTRFLMMMLGPAVGTLLFAFWLAFASRLPWRERLVVLALMIAWPAAISIVIHESIGLSLFLYGGPVSMLLVAAIMHWMRNVPTAKRLSAVVFALATVWCSFPLLKVNGFTGDYLPEFAWRWKQTTEERLLADTSGPRTIETDAEQVWNPPAEPWPQFRGTRKNGRVDWHGAELDWQSSSPQELWRNSVGPGWSSFAVVSDRLFTQEQRGADEAVTCYGTANGDLIWKTTSSGRFHEIVSGAGPRATPTYSDGHVFALGGNGWLQCLDASDGGVVWRKKLTDEFDVSPPMWGFSCSPLLVDSLCIVHVGGKGDDGVVAFDTETGEVVWRTASPYAENYCTPSLMEFAKRATIVFNNRDGLHAVSPSDGTRLWEFRPSQWNGPSMVQSQQLDGNSLVTSLGDGIGMARLQIQLADDGTWEVQESWSTRRLRPSFNGFVTYKGHAYGFDQNILTCLNLTDGSRRWKRGRYGFGQVVLIESTAQLIVISDEGGLILVDASPEAHVERGRVLAVPGKTWNHHVVGGNILYARNGESAVALRLAQGD